MKSILCINMKNCLKSNPVNSIFFFYFPKTVSITSMVSFQLGPSLSLQARPNNLIILLNSQQFRAPALILFYPILMNISYLWKIEMKLKNLYISETISLDLLIVLKTLKKDYCWLSEKWILLYYNKVRKHYGLGTSLDT